MNASGEYQRRKGSRTNVQSTLLATLTGAST
jgi:hypothetical protein